MSSRTSWPSCISTHIKHMPFHFDYLNLSKDITIKPSLRNRDKTSAPVFAHSKVLTSITAEMSIEIIRITISRTSSASPG